MIIQHKICDNCFAVMTYDSENNRFKCLSCGNAEPPEEELKRQPGSYIN